MAVDPATRLQHLLQTTEGKLRQQIVAAMAEAANDPDIGTLLKQGNFDAAAAKVGNDAANRIANAYTAAYVASGQATSTFLQQTAGIAIGFDVVNDRAVQHIQQNKFQLIREFTNTQRQVVGMRMQEGVRRGLNPIAQAREFRSSVGLTVAQQQWVQNYRAALERTAQGSVAALRRDLRDHRFDSSVRGAAKGTRKPLTAGEIDRMVQRYEERAIKYRAETIARTEALRAVNAAANEMYEQCVEKGVLKRDEVVRTWVAAKDERVRGSHKTLNGQKRKIGVPWDVMGGKLLYPGDPSGPAREVINCRCTVTVRFVTPKPPPVPPTPPPPTFDYQAPPTTPQDWGDWFDGDVGQKRRQTFTKMPNFFNTQLKRRTDGKFSSENATRAAVRASKWGDPTTANEITAALNSGTPLTAPQQQVVDSVSRAAKTFEKPVVSFRGMGFDSGAQSYKVGQTITASAPMSTNYDLQHANRWANGKVLWRIKSGDGARAFVFDERRKDVLYPAGTRFRVTGVKDDFQYTTKDGKGIRYNRLVEVEALAPKKAKKPGAAVDPEPQPTPVQGRGPGQPLLKRPQTQEEWQDWHSGTISNQRRLYHNEQIPEFVSFGRRGTRKDGAFGSEEGARLLGLATKWYDNILYKRISEKLRAKTASARKLSPEDQAVVDAIAATATPTRERHLTFRGIRDQGEVPYRVGDIVSAQQPLSTSYDYRTAAGFGQNQTVWEIHPRTGARVFVYNEREYEHLYPVGTRFKVIAVEDGPRQIQRLIRMEALAPDDID